jgi:hypothetical protein
MMSTAAQIRFFATCACIQGHCFVLCLIVFHSHHAKYPFRASTTVLQCLFYEVTQQILFENQNCDASQETQGGRRIDRELEHLVLTDVRKMEKAGKMKNAF